MLAADGLIASRWTLAGAGFGAPPRFGFEERVAAAATAGFSAIGLQPGDYEACRTAGTTDRALRQLVEDHGIAVVEVEGLWDWSADGDRLAACRADEERIWAVADVFAPRYVTAVDLHPPGSAPSMEQIGERFGELCDRSSAHGLQVALEFLPWTCIPNAQVAAEIVEIAGRPNGGVLVDTWHHFRGGGDEAGLRRASARVIAVQVSDAGPPTSDDLLVDTANRRLPGEGDFDLVGLIRVLEQCQVTATVAVEIVGPAFHSLPLDVAAGSAHTATRSVLEAARAS